MMKEFKLGVRLLKYGLGIKKNVACALLFIAVGFLFLFFMPSNSWWIFYWIMSTAFIVQLLYSLNVIALVNSAPRRKALHTSIPVILCLPLQLFFYGAGSLMELLMLHMGKVQEQDLAPDIIISGLVAILFMMYIGWAYKHYVISVIVAYVTIFATIIFGKDILSIIMPYIPLGTAMVIGLAEILLGACLQYLLFLLLYRQPVSKAGQMRQLQKYM